MAEAIVGSAEATMRAVRVVALAAKTGKPLNTVTLPLEEALSAMRKPYLRFRLSGFSELPLPIVAQSLDGGPPLSKVVSQCTARPRMAPRHWCA
jgi:hypothetical protein